jgi:hypothetical protein
MEYVTYLDKKKKLSCFAIRTNAKIILQELHNGIGGQHFSLEITMKKIFNASY